MRLALAALGTSGISLGLLLVIFPIYLNVTYAFGIGENIISLFLSLSITSGLFMTLAGFATIFAILKEDNK